MKKEDIINLAKAEYGWTVADAKRALKDIDSLPEEKTSAMEILLKWAGPELFTRQRLQRGQKIQVTKNKNQFQVKEKEFIQKENELKGQIEGYKQELETFLDLKNSEIYKAGLWLLSVLSKTGKERQESLLSKNLVHKEDYNESVSGLISTVEEQQQIAHHQSSEAINIIQELEKKNDNLRRQLTLVQDYIINNQGAKTWQEIQRYIKDDSL